METKDEYDANELSEFEKRWADREFPALAEAIEYCHTTSAAVPAWLAEAIIQELHAAFHGLGTRERGMTRSHKAKLERAQIQWKRAEWARIFLLERGPSHSGSLIDRRPMTREQAFEAASVQLRGSNAQGEAKEIEKAYDAQRRKEKRLRKSGETS
jgi:hypothetical protein